MLDDVLDHVIIVLLSILYFPNVLLIFKVDCDTSLPKLLCTDPGRAWPSDGSGSLAGG